MTTQELRDKLKDIKNNEEFDAEQAHLEADRALLFYIGDSTVTKHFNEVRKWYA